MTVYDVNELLLKLIEEPYDDLVRATKELSIEINNAMLELFDKKGEDKNFLFIYFGNSIVADGKFSDLEKKFILDVTNFTEENLSKVYSLLKEQQKQNTEYAKTIFKYLDLEIQAKIIVYCACFLAVDKITSIDEVEFIQELLEGE